jgi:hypothetical protein
MAVALLVEPKCQHVTDILCTGCEHQEPLEADRDTGARREAGL